MVPPSLHRRLFACSLAFLMLLGACANSNDSGGATATHNADISILFMGNSHSDANNIQGMAVAMIESAHPGKSVAAAAAPDWMFLDERIGHPPSLRVLRNQDWSYVILQAQKYSSSGQFVYSTDAAEAFVRLAREQNALPILFPEWPRRGIDETERIHDIHVGIAGKEPACVAPIGQAWDRSLLEHPDIVLHAQDGNHSNAHGAFLAALMLYASMTGHSPSEVPAFAESRFNVSESVQAALREMATATALEWPPRRYCPDDPVE